MSHGHHHHHNDHNHHGKESSNSHSHDTFHLVKDKTEGDVLAHFELVKPEITKYFQGKYNHIKLEDVYAKKNGKHDWKYWAQIQVGDFGDQHDWTVEFEIAAHDEVKMGKVHEGHKTFFG